MKLYDFGIFAPNPWVVHMFAAEKGIDLPTIKVDLGARENRREPFLSRINPMGELPVLELDDGTAISEVLAICEYLEEVQTDPLLIGNTSTERAVTRMWWRRIDLTIAGPMSEAFASQQGRAFFSGDQDKDGVMAKVLLPAEAGPLLWKKVTTKVLWLDTLMQGREWICGSRFGLADIYLYCFLRFGDKHGQGIPDGAHWIRDHFDRVHARPTA